MQVRVRTSWTASPTRAGNLRITTRTKVPMFPALRTSTTITAVPKRRKKKRK